MQPHGEIQRRLSAELHNHPGWLFDIDDIHHVFKRQRFEIQAVRSVVIGRNSFRIAVDHDRFVTRFVQRKGRMAAAVVKLDSLPDAVRSRSENHDLRPIGWLCFVFFFIGRVKIRRVGFELGAAGIHALVNRNQFELFAISAHFIFATPG